MKKPGIHITTQTKNGKPYTYLTVHFRDESNRQHTKSFPNTKEGKTSAERFLRELERKKETGVQIVSDLTVGRCVIDYIKIYKIQKVRNSTRQRLLTYSKKIKPLEKIPADKLTTETVQQWYNNMLENGLNARSANAALSLLKNALQKAKANRQILANPCDNIEKARVKKPEIKIFTTRQLRDILAAAKAMSRAYGTRPHHDYVLLLLMLATTGVRIAELLALEWKNIDLEHNLITIDKTKTGGNGQHMDAPKTERGKRTFPILAYIVRLKLRNQRETAIKNGDRFLFSTIRGKHKGQHSLSYKNIYPVMRRIMEKAGIRLEPHQGFHTFRHTFASLILRKRGDIIDIASLSRILGHSSAYVTTNFYLHAAQDDNERIVRELETMRKTRRKNKP